MTPSINYFCHFLLGARGARSASLCVCPGGASRGLVSIATKWLVVGGAGGRLAAGLPLVRVQCMGGVGHLLLSPVLVQNLARGETLFVIWLLQRFQFPHPPSPPASLGE